MNREEIIHQRLRLIPIGNGGKTIIAHLKSNALSRQRSTQVFSAIHAHLYGKRKPRLNTNMHKAKLMMIKITI